jgi:phenylalanyl-tRNA synthetase beta chain
MRVPLRWLQEYVRIDLPPEELAERLTLAGLEVTAIERFGVPGAPLEWDRERIVVGQILRVERHPNADRLLLATVDYGRGEPKVVVTGAPNLFPFLERPPERPLKVAFALEGATLYDGHQPGWVKMTLQGRAIRGIYSDAMVCSEKELGISEDHEGIILLDPEAPVGMPLADYMGDVVLEIDLTPNLAHAFSIIGVAREVAALTGKRLRYPPTAVRAFGPTARRLVRVRIEDPEGCPRYSAMVIRDVRIGPSPYWIQWRLRLCGMRPINNIVDITNYVMLEWGQPLHAFDYDRLVERAGGRPPTIIVRRARPGERIRTLDGVERDLDPEDLLICDEAGPIAIAGVMGGAETEVGEATRAVLLESANFDFISIRRTAARHKLPSEASARFGRGIHPALTLPAARRAAAFMQRLADGVVARGVVDAYARKARRVTLPLSAQDVERVLGFAIPPREIERILRALEFRVEPARPPARSRSAPAAWRVTVPDHRLDCQRPEDLIEEVARIWGYDRMPETRLRDPLPPQRGNPAWAFEERVRDILVACGLQEVITYALIHPDEEARLAPPGVANPYTALDYVRLINPISEERTVLRHTLLPGLLRTLRANLRFRERVAIFEVGKVFLPRPGEALPEEPRRIGIALTGPRDPASWLPVDRGRMDFFDLKGVVEALLERLHIPGVAFERAEHPSLHPGRGAEVKAGGRSLGILGELHPLVRRAWELPDQPVLIAELDLEALQALAPIAHVFEAVPRVPPVVEDLAFIVPESVPAAALAAVLREAGAPLVREVHLFDVYQGPPIPPGHRSLAFTVFYQAEDRTLTDREVATLRERLIRAAAERLGAVVRQKEEGT